MSLEPEGGAKLDDPVRLYLKEMGTVSLLTREGEVEIAKRIEEGEKEVLHSLLEVPVTLKEILNLTGKLEQERLAPQNGLDDFAEDDPLELPTQKSRVLKLIQKLRSQEEKIRQLHKEAATLPRKDEGRVQLEQKIAKERRRMVDNLKNLRLERHYLEDILNRLRLYGRLVREYQQRMEKCLAAANLNVTKFRNLKRSRKQNGGNDSQPLALPPERLKEIEDVWSQARRLLRRVEAETGMAAGRLLTPW